MPKLINARCPRCKFPIGSEVYIKKLEMSGFIQAIYTEDVRQIRLCSTSHFNEVENGERIALNIKYLSMI